MVKPKGIPFIGIIIVIVLIALLVFLNIFDMISELSLILLSAGIFLIYVGIKIRMITLIGLSIIVLFIGMILW